VPSVRVFTTFPARTKLRGVFFAGAEHGTPTSQTGLVGERVTRPFSPLAVTASAGAEPNASTAAAIAHFASISLTVPDAGLHYSACISERGRDPGDGAQERTERALVAGSVGAEELDLDGVHRVHIGVA
jgi:hypothetical protein